jgi:four helix bundle protein
LHLLKQMTLTNFTDLVAWQRAQELLLVCLQLLHRPIVTLDKRFHQQLADASASVPRNIAEGFGRFRPGENAQYVRVAKGSANEVLNLFIEARTKGYLTDAEFPNFETAARRAIGTMVNYLKYLERCKDDERWKNKRSAPRVPKPNDVNASKRKVGE